MSHLLTCHGDGSGMPVTWPGAITAVAFIALTGFIFWLILKDI